MRYALAIVALCGLTIGLLLSTTPNASAAPSLQLPWPVGVSHYIDVDQCTYNCLPYHVGSDLYAIDFHFPIVGDSVVASAAGTFVDGHNDPVNWDNRGNFLEIDHGGGYRTRYLHLSASQPWAPGIGINVTVTAGQLIAYSGNTGGVPAHLHFDVKLNGNAFKPENMSNVLDIAGGQTFGWYGANTGVRSPSWVADITTWHNWQDWGPIADAPPTAVSYDPTRRDHTHEAWRSGSDVMFRWWDGSIWQPAQNLSGGPSDPNFTGPVGISNHGNGIYVVGVSSGSSGEVWFKKYEPTTGWSTWSYLGRPPDGGIDGPVGVAFDPGDGQAHVVGVHAGTVFLKYGTTGNWIGWQNLGGSGTILNSVAVANRGGLVHVVGFTPASAHVWMTWWNGSSWQGWEDEGGVLDGALAIDDQDAIVGNVVLTPHYNVDIAAYSGGAVHIRCWDIDCPAGWLSQLGTTYVPPVAITNTIAQVRVVSRVGSNFKFRYKG